jgi:hypothetical protein
MAEPLLELDDQELELDRQQHPEVAHTSNTNSESQPPSRPAHTNSYPELSYSRTVAQPSAELSAIRINLLRSLNLVIKSIAT